MLGCAATRRRTAMVGFAFAALLPSLHLSVAQATPLGCPVAETWAGDFGGSIEYAGPDPDSFGTVTITGTLTLSVSGLCSIDTHVLGVAKATWHESGSAVQDDGSVIRGGGYGVLSGGALVATLDDLTPGGLLVWGGATWETGASIGSCTYAPDGSRQGNCFDAVFAAHPAADIFFTIDTLSDTTIAGGFDAAAFYSDRLPHALVTTQAGWATNAEGSFTLTLQQ